MTAAKLSGFPKDSVRDQLLWVKKAEAENDFAVKLTSELYREKL